MKRGERSPEAEKRYKKLQRKKKRYMELREELQVEGVIPVEPDGAIRDERVDPATQGEQHLPALVGQAVRRGWAVPEEKKPRLVDEMVAIIDHPEESNKVKVAAFNALRQADQSQFERDHPEVKAGKTGSGDVNIGSINVQNNIQAAALLREMLERGEFRITEEVQAPGQSSAPSDGGLEREVATGTSPDEDQQDAGRRVADA